jgi:hypothetical protein
MSAWADYTDERRAAHHPDLAGRAAKVRAEAVAYAGHYADPEERRATLARGLWDNDELTLNVYGLGLWHGFENAAAMHPDHPATHPDDPATPADLALLGVFLLLAGAIFALAVLGGWALAAGWRP